LLDGGGYDVKIKLFYKYCQILQKLLQVAKQILCGFNHKTMQKFCVVWGLAKQHKNIPNSKFCKSQCKQKMQYFITKAKNRL
jgi:hypothetical protein